MKHRLTITLIATAVLVNGGYWAIKNNIGKSKDITMLRCDGQKMIEYAGHKKSHQYFLKSTASVVITAEYYPWQNNKTYTIDYNNSGHVLEWSTNRTTTVYPPLFGGDGKSARLSVNQHEIKFDSFERTTVDNKNWTKAQIHEQWRTFSHGQNLTLNLVTLEIQVADKFTSMTMKEYSGTRDETKFNGNCTVIQSVI